MAPEIAPSLPLSVAASEKCWPIFAPLSPSYVSSVVGSKASAGEIDQHARPVLVRDGDFDPRTQLLGAHRADVFAGGCECEVERHTAGNVAKRDRLRCVLRLLAEGEQRSPTLLGIPRLERGPVLLQRDPQATDRSSA